MLGPSLRMKKEWDYPPPPLGLVCGVCEFVTLPFWGFKILNFNILGGFQKNGYFFEVCENFVDIFWGLSQNWNRGVVSMHFRVFS